MIVVLYNLKCNMLIWLFVGGYLECPCSAGSDGHPQLLSRKIVSHAHVVCGLSGAPFIPARDLRVAADEQKLPVTRLWCYQS
jgi:hypothetical protein